MSADLAERLRDGDTTDSSVIVIAPPARCGAIAARHGSPPQRATPVGSRVRCSRGQAGSVGRGSGRRGLVVQLRVAGAHGLDQRGDWGQPGVERRLDRGGAGRHRRRCGRGGPRYRCGARSGTARPHRGEHELHGRGGQISGPCWRPQRARYPRGRHHRGGGGERARRHPRRGLGRADPRPQSPRRSRQRLRR